MSNVTPICRCSDHDRFHGGCSICNPEQLRVETDWDDEYFYITKRTGRTKTMMPLTHAEKMYVIERAIASGMPFPDIS